jgi:hypothetical protein
VKISDAILLVRGTCKRQRLSLSTEKAYTHWVHRYGLFLKGRSQIKDAPPNLRRFRRASKREKGNATGCLP